MSIQEIIQKNKEQLQAPWLPVFSLFISLYGIVFLEWEVFQVVFMFWWEVILSIGFGALRSIFALSSRPFRETLLQKIPIVAGVLFMGIILMMLTATFTLNNFQANDMRRVGGDFSTQINLLSLGYLANFLIKFLFSGDYKVAHPAEEALRPLLHIFVILALLMLVNMHLLPNYPAFNHAKWGVSTLVIVKFMVDWAFLRLQKPVYSQQS